MTKTNREIIYKEIQESGSVNFSMTYQYNGNKNYLLIGGHMMLPKDGVLTDATITEAQDALMELLSSMKKKYGELPYA